MEEAEKEFEDLLKATENIELIEKYVELKMSIALMMENAIKFIDQQNTIISQKQKEIETLKRCL